MAKLLKIKHPPAPLRQQTFLSAKYTSGTGLNVRSTFGWAINSMGVIGIIGMEKTEKAAISLLPSDITMMLNTALKFEHQTDSPLMLVDYDQISIERKPSGGNFAEIVEGKKDIAWDENDGFTKVVVAAGVDGDTFRWRFYNTLTAAYSSYSAELLATGLTVQHAGYLIEAVRIFGKIPAATGVKDQHILMALNFGQRQIDAMKDNWYFCLTEDSDTTRLTASPGIYKYALPDHFRSMDVLQVLDLNSQRYNLGFRPLIEFDSMKVDRSSATRSDSSAAWTFLPPDSDNPGGYIGVHPTPATAGIYFYRRYYQYLPELVTFSSKTLVPLPETLMNFAIFSLYKDREDKENALFYYGLFTEGVNLLKRLQRKQVGQMEIQRWRGQRGLARLFGDGFAFGSVDAMRENNW